jgi:hypothetical protein
VPVIRAVLICAASVLAAAAPARAACPVINGEYWMDIEKEGRVLTQSVTLFTRKEGNAFSYTVDGDENYQLADGVGRPYVSKDGRRGTVRLECIGNSLRQESKADNSTKVWRSDLTPIGETQLRVETNLSYRSGIYTRVRQSPERRQ